MPREIASGAALLGVSRPLVRKRSPAWEEDPSWLVGYFVSYLKIERVRRRSNWLGGGHRQGFCPRKTVRECRYQHLVPTLLIPWSAVFIVLVLKKRATDRSACTLSLAHTILFSSSSLSISHALSSSFLSPSSSFTHPSLPRLVSQARPPLPDVLFVFVGFVQTRSTSAEHIGF
jgi:hypothetical protein